MGGQGGCNANAGVPASSRNVVQSLKEMMIVKFSDSEIYAMLVECDMDPDQTVDRLLSQDTFHEVKSKRAKKKVTKESAESRAAPSIPNRGAGNIGNDSSRGSGGGGNRFNSNGTGSVQGVRAHKSENGTRNHCAGSSSSTLGVLGRQPLTNSEVKKAPTVSNDVVASLPLPSPPNQSAWVSAKPGQRTMADIIKMSMQPLPQKNNGSPRSSETHENDGSKSPLKDEWPMIEKQDGSEAKTSPLVETCLDDEENPEGKTSTVMSPPDADLVVPPSSVSSRNLVDDDLTDSSLYDDESNEAESDAFVENGGEDVSESVATGFQQLAIEDRDQEEALPEDNKRILIISKHLQAHTSECSHIMFGTYNPGLGSSQASGLNGNNLEETQETEDNSSFRHPDTEFYGDEEEDQLRNGAIDEQGSYQIDSASSESETEDAQREPLQEDLHQYKFPSSVGYGFENSQPLIPQAQNLDSVMQQGYTGLLQNTQDMRGSDLRYMPFPTNHNNTATPSSLSGPAISMAEALRAEPESISPQNVIPAAQYAALLALNAYPQQPGMPLANYGNVINYHYSPQPQSYSHYVPSPFQQVFPATNHQSIPGMLPQYKTQSNFAPSAYGFGGGAGSSSSSNFAMNHTSPANSYEDVLSSQFQDRNHSASSLQYQNENSQAWHQGQEPNARMVLGNGYYSLPAHQNQQVPDFRHAQQLQQQQQMSQQQQHYGGHGYGAMSLDHLRLQQQQQQQQQNGRHASKQNQHKFWPNNY